MDKYKEAKGLRKFYTGIALLMSLSQNDGMKYGYAGAS
jgi:hypothetical protein